MTQEQLKEIAPLYVLGALDEKTACDVEAALSRATSEHHHDINEWRRVAAFLPEALPLQTPAGTLRERVLNRITGELHQAPIETATERPGSSVLPFVRRPRDESRATRWMLIAATALLAFAVGYMFRWESDFASERDDLLREMAARTAVISMAGVEAPQANAKIVWDMKTRQWEVYISDLPAPPSDKDYQLWYVTSNAKISAAVFRTDYLGRALLKLTLPSDAQDVMSLTAVTLEPRGGSSQPTGKFYLKSSI